MKSEEEEGKIISRNFCNILSIEDDDYEDEINSLTREILLCDLNTAKIVINIKDKIMCMLKMELEERK